MKKLLLILLLLPSIAFAKNEEIAIKDVITIDGDTIKIIDIDIPKDLQPHTFRIYGIDTPESQKQFAKCKKEIELGLKAKKFTENFIDFRTDNLVFVKMLDTDKYGRILAEVRNSKGQYLHKELIKAGLAVEYYGEKKSKDWCK